MPSGAKKRKAAKKKKGNQFNNSSSTSTSSHSHGDDLKHQDDKAESDVGEIKNDKIIVVEDDSVVKVEREFKIEDESNGSSNSNGSSSGSNSGSSSSDDESHGIKESQSTVDNSPVFDSGKTIDSLSETPSEAIIQNATIEEARVSVEETPVSEESVVDIVSPGDNSVASYGVDDVSNENGEKNLNSVEDKVGISVVSKSKEEGTNIQSVEDSVAISVPKECVEPENDDRSTISHVAPPSATAEHEKDSRVTQPLLAPAQRAVQTTSWKSCCGLFELFNGSGR
ncbi:hypothetical protein ACJIZ3_008318 [Penstemon smallii]|uniref:Uncharacterized protein n=1 Tax=Penstemon smallii TaxID=265156 RepID=A0ABD3T9D8_9LAMI